MPRNDSPNGWLGPLERVGRAGASVVLGGRKPRGTGVPARIAFVSRVPGTCARA